MSARLCRLSALLLAALLLLPLAAAADHATHTFGLKFYGLRGPPSSFDRSSAANDPTNGHPRCVFFAWDSGVSPPTGIFGDNYLCNTGIRDGGDFRNVKFTIGTAVPAAPLKSIKLSAQFFSTKYLIWGYTQEDRSVDLIFTSKDLNNEATVPQLYTPEVLSDNYQNWRPGVKDYKIWYRVLEGTCGVDEAWAFPNLCTACPSGQSNPLVDHQQPTCDFDRCAAGLHACDPTATCIANTAISRGYGCYCGITEVGTATACSAGTNDPCQPGFCSEDGANAFTQFKLNLGVSALLVDSQSTSISAFVRITAFLENLDNDPSDILGGDVQTATQLEIRTSSVDADLVDFAVTVTTPLLAFDDDEFQFQILAAAIKDADGTTQKEATLAKFLLTGRELMQLHPARESHVREFITNTDYGRVRVSVAGVYDVEIPGQAPCRGWSCSAAVRNTKPSRLIDNSAWLRYNLEPNVADDAAGLKRSEALEASTINVLAASGEGATPVLILSPKLLSKTTEDNTGTAVGKAPLELLRTKGVPGSGVAAVGCDTGSSTNTRQTCPSEVDVLTSEAQALEFSHADGLVVTSDFSALISSTSSFTVAANVKFSSLSASDRTVVFHTQPRDADEVAALADDDCLLTTDVRRRGLVVFADVTKRIKCCLGRYCIQVQDTLSTQDWYTVGCAYNASAQQLTAFSLEAPPAATQIVTASPTAAPTSAPTTPAPTTSPTRVSTTTPSPTPSPTPTPTTTPTRSPTPSPTTSPTPSPTDDPSITTVTPTTNARRRRAGTAADAYPDINPSGSGDAHVGSHHMHAQLHERLRRASSTAKTTATQIPPPSFSPSDALILGIGRDTAGAANIIYRPRTLVATRYGGCQASFGFNGLGGTAESWFDAEETCRAHGGHLASASVAACDLLPGTAIGTSSSFAGYFLTAQSCVNAALSAFPDADGVSMTTVTVAFVRGVTAGGTALQCNAVFGWRGVSPSANSQNCFAGKLARWVGLNSNGAPDAWQFTSGKNNGNVLYNWYNGEWPGSGEGNCGVLVRTQSPARLRFAAEPCSSVLPAVCQVPSSTAISGFDFHPLSATSPLSFAAASTACSALGGVLLTIETVQKLEDVERLLDGTDVTRLWIGLSRASASSDWIWDRDNGGANMGKASPTTSNVDDISSFKTGSTYASDRRCAAVARNTAFTLLPLGCDQKLPFVCEFEEYYSVSATQDMQMGNVYILDSGLDPDVLEDFSRNDLKFISDRTLDWDTRLAITGTSVKAFFNVDENLNRPEAIEQCNAYETEVSIGVFRELREDGSCSPDVAPKADIDDETCWEYRSGYPNQLRPDWFYQLRASFNSYDGGTSEIWLPFQTTCGCTVDNPSGKPTSFRAFQTTEDFRFAWIDESYCEEGYNFYRNGEAINVEYTRKGDCFERHITTASGDVLTPESQLNVNTALTYCIAAIGAASSADPDTLYTSERACVNVTVAFVAELSGRVQTEAGEGVGNIVVSASVLSLAEKGSGDFPELHVIEFLDTSSRRRRRRDATPLMSRGAPSRAPNPAPTPQRTARFVANASCPADTMPARDAEGNLLYLANTTAGRWQPQFFPATPAGEYAVLECPYPLLRGPTTATTSVRRLCGIDAVFEDPADACDTPDPLSFFQAAQIGHYIVEFNTRKLTGVSVANCAWECLFFQTCVSFEYDPASLSCFLSEAKPSEAPTSSLVSVASSPFASAIQLALYEIQPNLPRRQGLTTDAKTAMVPSGTVCRPAELECLSFSPQGFSFQSAAQTAQFALLGCEVWDGDLIIQDCEADLTTLFDLRRLRHVTGTVTIARCPALTTLTGLGQLQSIGSVTARSSLTIADNPLLSGPGLRVMLSGLYESVNCKSIQATVTNNPRLCPSADWPASWTLTNNALDSTCGCTLPLAQNYQASATFDDGSCKVRQCAACMAGTVGNCHAPASHVAGDHCIEVADEAECTARIGGAFCDPCADIICSEPPTSCHLATGSCNSLTGRCEYGTKAEGDACNDGNLQTGPDRCNANAECVGTISCSVPDLLSYPAPTTSPTPTPTPAPTPAPTKKKGGWGWPWRRDLDAVGDAAADPKKNSASTRSGSIERRTWGHDDDDDDDATPSPTPRPTPHPTKLLPYLEPIRLQAELDQLAECAVIASDLVIDCSASNITSLAALADVITVAGAVVFQNCDDSVLLPSSYSAHCGTAMPLLTAILGNNEGASLTLVNTTWPCAPSVLFPSLAEATGTLVALNNPNLCLNLLFHDDYRVEDNADASLCGCTVENSTNLDPSAVLDDGTCIPDLCLNVVCDDAFPCFAAGVCSPATGECEYAPLEVGTACDDGSDGTFNDTCKTNVFGELVCVGTDLCFKEGFCPTRECYSLLGCRQATCEYQPKNVNDSCDDGLGYTSGETCILTNSSTSPITLECGNPTEVDYCFQPDLSLSLEDLGTKHVMEVRNGVACEANLLASPRGGTGTGSADDLQLARPSLEAGSIVSFNVHLPNVNTTNEPRGVDGLLAFTLLGTQIFPSAALERTEEASGAGAASNASSSSLPANTAAFTTSELQGHWEIEVLPSGRWMIENCQATCYAEALLERKLQSTVGDAVEFWFDLCGTPGICIVPVGSSGDANCASNAAGAVICERYKDFCLQADLEAKNFELDVAFYSHNLLRDSLVDYAGRLEVASSATSTINAGINFAVFQDLAVSPPLAENEEQRVDIYQFDVRPYHSFKHSVTESDGTFDIDLVAEIDGADAEPNNQLVVVYPYAVTKGFLHQYTGGKGDGQEANHFAIQVVEHLREAPNLVFNDVTGYVVSGRVSMADAIAGFSEAQMLVDPASCPVRYVQVCAVAVGGPQPETINCVETDAAGAFRLFVVESAELQITATLDGHTFIADDVLEGGGADAADVGSVGVGGRSCDRFQVVGLESDLDGLHFRDATPMFLDVAFGGGSCLKDIGQAAFAASSLDRGAGGCALASNLVFSTDEAINGVRRWIVPAQNYTVALVEDAGVEANNVGLYSFTELETFFLDGAEVEVETAQRGMTRSALFVAPQSTESDSGEVYIAEEMEDEEVAERAEANARVSCPPLVDPEASALVSWELRVPPTLEMTIGGTTSRAACQFGGLVETFILESGDDQTYPVKINLYEEYRSPTSDTRCLNVTTSVLIDDPISREQRAGQAFAIVVDVQNGLAVSSQVNLQINAPEASIVAPYTKSLVATFSGYRPAEPAVGLASIAQGVGVGKVQAVAIVRGSVPVANRFAIKVPEYIPFLVLRDPPGGASKASFSREHKRTLELSLENKVDRNMKLKGTGKISFGGLDTSGCAGGIFYYQCVKQGKAETKFGLSVDVAFNAEATKDGHLSLEMTTSIEYATSEDPGIAGAAADLFVTPALSIVFGIDAVIDVPDGTCTATRTDVDTWFVDGSPATTTQLEAFLDNSAGVDESLLDSVADLDGVVALAKQELANADAQWNTMTAHTRFDIMSVRIPQLQERVDSAQLIIDCKQNYEPDKCTLSLATLQTLPTALEVAKRDLAQAAIDGWIKTLEIDYALQTSANRIPLVPQVSQGFELLNAQKATLAASDAEADVSDERAAGGKKLAIASGVSFGVLAVASLGTSLPATIAAIGTGLNIGINGAGNPGAVATSASSIDDAGDAVAAADVSQADIPAPGAAPEVPRNMISFTGGGNSYTFTAAMGETRSRGTKDSYSWEVNLGTGWDTELRIFSIGPTSEGEFEGSILHEGAEQEEQSGLGDTTTTTFSLGDPEIGDRFDVMVWMDPVYGTPIFETVSGASICAVEAGTEGRERWQLGIQQRDQKKAVFNYATDGFDEELLFEIFLSNLSPTNEQWPAKLLVVQESLQYADETTKERGGTLFFSLNGKAWAEPRTTQILPVASTGSNSFVVSVRRPLFAGAADSYTNVRIQAVSNCEFDLFYGNGLVKTALRNSDGVWAGCGDKSDPFEKLAADNACWQDGLEADEVSFDIVFPPRFEVAVAGAAPVVEGEEERGGSATGSGAEIEGEGGAQESQVRASTVEEEVAMLTEEMERLVHGQDDTHVQLWVLLATVVLFFAVTVAVLGYIIHTYRHDILFHQRGAGGGGGGKTTLAWDLDFGDMRSKGGDLDGAGGNVDDDVQVDMDPTADIRSMQSLV